MTTETAKVDTIADTIEIVSAATPRRPGKTAIYVLVPPDGSEIRYVGKAVDPANRLRQHCQPSLGSDTHKDRWVRSLLAAGKSPRMAIIEWVDDWETAERAWISRLRADGHPLMNISDGGNIPWPKGQKKGYEPCSPYKRAMTFLGVCKSKLAQKGLDASHLEVAQKALRKRANMLVRSYGKAGREQINAELANMFPDVKRWRSEQGAN